MSNRIKHQKLLEVPQRDRDAKWFADVQNLFIDTPAKCDKCDSHFSIKKFTDEANDGIVEITTCPLCMDVLQLDIDIKNC